MATLALAAAGQAIGGAVGGSLLGMSAAALGQFVGASVGRMLDTMWMTDDVVTKSEGARLTGAQYLTSTEGAPIPTLVGRSRVGGELIWATDFTEEIVTERVSQGGKGGPKQVSETTTYVYTTSFAIGLCEGNQGMAVARAWADGKQMDLNNVTWRFYDGTQTLPDELIVAREGVESTPCFQKTAYIVFEAIELTNYGNRIPQITVELVSPVTAYPETSLERQLGAINIIPGSGEFVYATTGIQRVVDEGETATENNHYSSTVTDFVSSLNDLDRQLPNVSSASIVVSWFGTDTDGGLCDIEPRVDNTTKETEPDPWVVGGLSRASALAVPEGDFGPVFGGTPSDKSVREAFVELKDREHRAMFYPFILMVSEGYPWRGEIEGSATSFLGTAATTDFTKSGDTVNYSGPAEWSHRRMILHYAHLLSDILEAGDIFLVGSEMVGMTNSDAAWGTGLATLIADVKSVLPAGVEVSYASNWDEYNHASLAPVWSSADFVGIDYYMPLTDWRTDADRDMRLDTFVSGFTSGEYWDYYYATEQDRIDGVTTPITDPQYRQKDIGYWLTNAHPSKRVVLTEFGCPAIDKGANQPNQFFDQNSANSGSPWFSTEARDDTVQRLYLEAALSYLPTTGFVAKDDMFAWAWDARPFPSFPGLIDVWSDAENYPRGHWLNGRTGSSSIEDVIRYFTRRVGLDDELVDTDALASIPHRVRGLVVTDTTSPRNVLNQVMTTYKIDCLESGDGLVFFPRGWSSEATVDLDDLVVNGDEAAFKRSRVKSTDLPVVSQVDFIDELRDYQTGSVDARSPTGASDRVESFATPVLIDEDYGFALANVNLSEKWIARDSVNFTLPFGSPITETDYYSTVVPGVWFDFEGYRYRAMKVTYGDDIEIEAVGFNPDIYEISSDGFRLPNVQSATVFGPSLVVFAELPLINSAQMSHWSPRIATYQSPWPSGVAFYEPDGSGGYSLNTVAGVRDIIGETVSDLDSGPVWRWDNANEMRLRIYNTNESLSSVSEESVLNGANMLALQTPSGEWEIIQFVNAELNLDGTYTLTKLLRGQLGTETHMADTLPSGSRVVMYQIGRMAWLEGSDTRLGIETTFRYGPSSVGVADDRFREQTVTPRGVAYRPYAPVHLTQALNGSDIDLSWVRRTRLGGDSWETDEVPLNEEFERYEVDILDGSTVVRTLVVDNATSVTYTAAQQTADFGSTQTSVSWVVHQMSAIFGRGSPANA